MWNHAALVVVTIAVLITGLAQLVARIAVVDPAPVSFPALRPLNVTASIVDVERFFEDDDEVLGPESFVLNEDGSFFTGTARGDILRVILPPFGGTGGAHFDVVARMGSASDRFGCGALVREPLCGRPLGMRRDPSRPGGGNLLVCDAYRGLVRVDTATGKVETLVASRAHGLALVNDLDVSADGRFAFFTNTGRFPRNEIHRNLIEARPSGSVWCVDLETGQARTVVEGLVMANGVTRTFEGDALLVTVLQGIVRVELPAAARLAEMVASGAGLPLRAEVVQDDLQGTPDNIRRFDRARHSYLVALGSTRASPFSLPQFVAPYLVLRRLSSLLGLEQITSLIPQAGLLAEVDGRGALLGALADPSPSSGTFWLSEAEPIGELMGEATERRVLLGSWRAPFVARARLTGPSEP